MRLALIWRMIAPTLVVSLLLLAVGLAAAMYVYLWNSRVALDLDRRLSSVLAVNDLVLSIRDVRVELDEYLATRDAQFLTSCRMATAVLNDRLLAVCEQAAPENGPSCEQLRNRVDDLVERIQQITKPQPEELESVRVYLNEQVLAAAYGRLDYSRKAVLEASRKNQRIAGLVGTGLAALGLCGAAAGLVAGYGVARSVARSIEQLGGSIQAVAQTLADDNEAGDDQVVPIAGLRDLISTMGRISERTAGVVSELEQSRETAVRSDQMAAIGQLAAGIAHELRNPLTAVKLLVDTAAERQQPLPESDLAVVQEEVLRMDAMLRSFLDFARPPKLRRQPVDLSEIVRQAVDLVRPRAAVHEVTISCHAAGPAVASADAQQLRQVVINLLMNAIDAQPGGGVIRVEVATVDQQGRLHCLVLISDVGPGIAQEVADKLFEPFVSTKETGVGLGLAISRRIARSHGGEIEASNLAEGGAQFSILVPLEDNA